MIRRMRRGHKWGLWVVLAVVLSGGGGGCVAVKPQQPAEEEAFDQSEAERMVKAGYGAIADRYITDVDIGVVATAALRGLPDLDPALAVGQVGKAINVSARGKPLAAFDAPKAQDVEAWAKLTVKVWRAARQSSRLIAATPQEEVYEALFDRAAAALDASARYASASEARRNRQRRDGYNAIGIGLRLQGDLPSIVEVTGRGPGERAGLRVGDVIVDIEDQPTAGLPVEVVTERLQNDVTGWVRLTVRRTGRGTLHFLVRRSFLIPDTVTERYEDGVLYLAVSHFNQGTADSIEETLRELSSDLGGRLRGVLLDLRGNPGGLLQQSVKVADLFLASGEILSTRGRHADSNQDYVAGGDDAAHGLPLVVLIDGDSASAAELVAAVLQDRGRSILVGSSSYGKGTVQTVVPLPNGGELSFTWSRAVPPGGPIAQGAGVTPAICTSGLYVIDQDSLATLFYRDAAARPEAAGCPAEKRGGPVDLEVAHRLIDDADLYVSMLGRGPVVATVQMQAVP